MKTILITGASSGIGRALALYYAAPGVRLAITGRNAQRLKETETLCQERGSEVHTACLDVTDAERMAEWVAGLDQRFALDMVIANAGISGGTGGIGLDESLGKAQEIFAVNIGGVLNTLRPVIPGMVERGMGKIVLIASLAGILPLPGAPAYSASKAAIRHYGKALGLRLRAFGIRVSVVCPGFVETEMTKKNPFPMPFLMSAEKAARLIAAGIDRGSAEISFPWPMATAIRVLALLPDFLQERILARLPEKRG